MNYPSISLEAARINADLTQDEAASKLGICKATLRNYEKGKTVPNYFIMQKIEEVYNFPKDYIFLANNYA